MRHRSDRRGMMEPGRRRALAVGAALAACALATVLGCSGEPHCGSVGDEPVLIDPGPGRWAEPQQLAAVRWRGAVREPQVVADAAGIVTAMWSEDGTLCARRFDPATGWSRAAVVSTDVDLPRVAADAHGGATAVWSTFAATIGASRFSPDTGWSSPEVLDPDDTVAAQAPAVASDAEGRATAVWSDGTPEIRARTFIPGSGWGPVAALATGDMRILGGVDVAASPDGAVAVWGQWGLPLSWTIRASRLAGSAWQPPVVVDPTFRPSSHPRVFIDGAGAATLTWFVGDPTGAWTARDRPDGSWGPAARVSADTTDTLSWPLLAGSANGAAAVIWQQYDAHATYDVWGSQYVPASGWAAPVRLDPEPGSSMFPMAVGLDPDGNGAALLVQDDDTQNVWVRRLDARAGWQPAEMLGPAPFGNAFGAVAFDPAGRGTAVWANRDGVWASTYH